MRSLRNALCQMRTVRQAPLVLTRSASTNGSERLSSPLANTAGTLRLVKDAISYETTNGLENVQSTKPFSEFLIDQLSTMGTAFQTRNENLKQDIYKLQALAEQYPFMTKQERRWMLEDTLKVVKMLDATLEADIGLVIAEPALVATAGNENKMVVSTKHPKSALSSPVAAPTSPNVDVESPRTLPPWSRMTWTQQATMDTSYPLDCTRWVPIIFDFETTGLDVKLSHPVEVAALNPLTGDTFSSLIRLPKDVSMHPQAERVTGISTAMVSDSTLPDFSVVYLSFLEFIEGQMAASGEGSMPVLIGHNIRKYDVKLLLNRARAVDLAVPREAAILDTYLAAQKILAGQKSYKLGELVPQLTGKGPQNAHRAAADVAMTATLLECLLESAGVDSRSLPAFFSRRRLPPAFDGGFVGQLMMDAAASSARRGENGSAKQGRRGASALLTPSQFGATDATWGTVPTPAKVASVNEEFCEEAWALDDPLALVENEVEESLYVEDAASGVGRETKGREGGILDWQPLLLNPETIDCFLHTSVDELPGRSKFTPTQIKDSRAAGLPRFIDVLQCWPRGYAPAGIGQLPDLENPDEQAICLLVQLAGQDAVNVKIGKNGAWSILTATFTTVYPSDDVHGLPSSVHEAAPQRRRPQFLLKIFRKGRGARWAVNNEEAKLLQFGGSAFAISARVTRAVDGSFPPDTWTLKDNSLQYMSLQEYDKMANEREQHVRVVYSSKNSVPPNRVAALTAKALSILRNTSTRWNDPVPEAIRQQYGLAGFVEAMEGMHSPSTPSEYEHARRRIAFQELFFTQLKALIQRAALRAAYGSTESPERDIQAGTTALAVLAQQALPYELTDGQCNALQAVRRSLAAQEPMMCLLQGDVGCGKTAVALLAVMDVVGSGYQAAIMAPTEILAEQHFKSLTRLVTDMNDAAPMESSSIQSSASGIRDLPICSPVNLPNAALLTGSTRKAERNDILTGLRNGEIDVIVGTHALISEGVEFNSLGLGVIDEQHKFGVRQRAKLLSKACPSPHILSMSATPIPRSLALVHHGQLALVTIPDLPPGRVPVSTHVLEDTSENREALHAAIRREVAEGGQVFIVCPLIESTSAGQRTGNASSAKGGGVIGGGELKAAVQERDRLVREGVLRADECAVMHGRLSSMEKEASMAAFAAGKVSVLISTTVVEVGVDVPAASLMVVEHADRFGLAQLHQLRGRVGRGTRAASCYLIAPAARDGGDDVPSTDNEYNQVLERLKVLESSSNGFEVAEADFALRGGGDVLGVRQSGRLGDVKGTQVSRLPQDAALLEMARKAAALHLVRAGKDAAAWPPELLAAVADPEVLALDFEESNGSESAESSANGVE